MSQNSTQILLTRKNDPQITHHILILKQKTPQYVVLNGAELGIRTPGSSSLQRFSRPPLSTAQPTLHAITL